MFKKILSCKNNRLIWLLLQLTLVLSSAFLIALTADAAPGIEGIQVYQKNLHDLPEHKQKLAADINRYHHADNIWDVLRDEFTLPHYEDNPAVQDKIDWYMNNQDYLLRSATRAAPYLYYILQQVKKRHLPAELVLLPIIESGYNPFSLSTVGAAGIWQLMPATAAGLGVRQDWWYDGRKDVITSTRAALNHLAYLQSVYEGNWLLALAAYDTGEGNLRAAMMKNIRNGLDTDFWSLPVAAETRNYVPSLLALAVIISHPDQYPVYLPPVRNAPYLAQIDVGAQINLKHAAVLAGLSHKKLLQLNPGFSRPITPSKGPFKLVLPIENVEKFTESLIRSPLNTQIKWTHYKVNTGDTLVSIAKKFRTNPTSIRKLNQLSKNSVHQGMRLLIPVNESPIVTNDIHPAVTVSNPTPTPPVATSKAPDILAYSLRHPYKLKPGDTVYMVRNNDTLAKIAQRFRIHPQLIQVVNQLHRHPLTPGKQIIIPTHPAQRDGIQPGDTLYIVRRGDTIEDIAYKYHTTTAAIRLANIRGNNFLREGERLVVPTHTQS